jgi:DNA anti-recombination protein RmuC
MADDVQQQLLAFQEKAENSFDKVAKDNNELMEKLNMGLQSIREDMQDRLDKIERLLMDAVHIGSSAKACDLSRGE